MPDFEFEFSQQDKDLVVTQTSGDFGGTDYIRLTIYPSEAINNIVDLPDSSKGVDGKAIFFSTLSQQEMFINISPFTDENTFRQKVIGGSSNGDFKIYQNPNAGIYLKPNEIFNQFELPEGNYKIQIDFLHQLSKGQLFEQNLPMPYWFEEFDITNEGILNIPDVTAWGQNRRTDIALAVQSIVAGDTPQPPKFNDDSSPSGGPAPGLGPGQQPPSEDQPDFRGSDFFIPNIDEDIIHYKFILKQVSTSRKEVRLKILGETIINNSDIIGKITNELNNSTDAYQFKHILNDGTGNHIPIMNYQFDAITDGRDNQSLILKLYDALPTNVGNLSLVTIEKEVLTTQTQDIFYFSDVPDVFFGDGLVPDVSENWINPDGNDVGFESIDELAYSSSMNEVQINSIISQSQYGYPNLNTNFNEFENHTFFGSAKKKLQNFKTKVDTIQTHYSELSESLSVSCSINGDSRFIIQKRKNIFNKIYEEFKTFTPYENFLYFDGQSESTASAPSLRNYANTIPVALSENRGDVLSQTDGFNTVYKYSSVNLKGTGSHQVRNNLFGGLYQGQNKPFFNYSGSIYLSFLLQGDSGSSLIWKNSQQEHNPPYPDDSLFQNNILNPDMTSSKYQRYIFEASQSYFIPRTVINDMADLSLNDGDFDAGSTKVQFLSGSVKTGSYLIKDSTNLYPMTVVTQSGAPFIGSVMPGGELFNIFYENNLSSSLIGYYDYQGVTIDDGDFEVFDRSGNNNTLQFKGDGGQSFTSASISEGVAGGDGFSLTFSGSSEGTVGALHLSTEGVSVPIENNPIVFTTGSGEDLGFDGFTMTTFFQTTSSKTNTTIMAMDIKSSGSCVVAGVITQSNQTDKSEFINVDGFYISRLSDTLSGEITNQGHVIVAQNDSDNGIKTAATDIRDGNFHHIAMTYDNTTGTASMYFDGVLKKEGHAVNLMTGSNQINRLIVGSGPGSAQGYADGVFDETRFYTRVLNANEINQLFLHPDGVTGAKLTDVKVTLDNPTDVYPFDNIFRTDSNKFTDWYNNALTQAETFDTDNIHSLENNLPLYMKESSDYNEMKDFLGLQGEQYDLIRNHIDSMGTLHDRGYKETNSPPNNILPMLLSNMGWQAINPFEGDLTETLGDYLTGITSIDDIKNNTWRKTLNNLLYIYKSKGTKNSVRALLNTYGYPPDILDFKEFGGSTENQIGDGKLISDSPPVEDVNKVDLNLSVSTGSYGFTSVKQKQGRYMFRGKTSRILNFDWWMDDANINTIQFVYKHVKSTNTQTIVRSSGSADETLWDLRLVPDSVGLSSSLEFRLSNAPSTASSVTLASNAVSMSTPYSTITDGQLWNIMLQRVTGTSTPFNPSTTHEYRLHLALQDKDKISVYNYTTMSLDGSTASNKFANENFQSSGSRQHTSSSNLFIGGDVTGSIAEFRGWSTALSASRFRQHTLNKSSTVGNTILSHCHELVYHFKLDENYVSASFSSSAQTLPIIDSSPTKKFSDYSFSKTGTFFTGSFIYGSDLIDTLKISLQDNVSRQTDNTILINPKQPIVGDLNSKNPSLLPSTDSVGKKPLYKTSTKLEIYRSPQQFLDNFILDKISGFNLEKKYANPMNFYSGSYNELDELREEFFDCYPFDIGVNKFIRGHETMFNHSITEGIKSLVPARSTFSDRDANFGVEIKPTMLEKQKYEHHDHSVETNPNTRTGSINVDVVNIATFENPKTGSISAIPLTTGSSFELPKSASISVITVESITTGSVFVLPKSGSISVLPSTSDSAVVLPKSGTIDYASELNKSFVNIHDSWGTGVNDTHFLNYANDISSVTSDYNTDHIDTRFVFHSIGDNEYYSASNASDFSNSDNFYNRKMIDTDFHTNVSYESLIGGISSSHHTGRMLGKTRYFRTGSDGSIILPRNHVRNFSQPFVDRMNNGTQNENPGQLNVQYEDYATSSFYSVTVTGGENQIRVNSGNPQRGGGDEKIIYR